jgi:hypothetical protein
MVTHEDEDCVLEIDSLQKICISPIPMLGRIDVFVCQICHPGIEEKRCPLFLGKGQEITDVMKEDLVYRPVPNAVQCPPLALGIMKYKSSY